MNPFKNLFKFSDNTPSRNDKTKEQSTQEFQQPSEDNSERKHFTEEETNELIKRFTDYGYDFDGFDFLLESAARLIIQEQNGSASVLQRKLKLGYNKANRLMGQLVLLGIVKTDPPRLPIVLLKTERELDGFLKRISYRPVYQTFYNEHKAAIEKNIKDNQEQKIQSQIEAEKNTIRQELLEKEHRKNLHRQVYKELLDQGVISNLTIDNERGRQPIPQDVMDKVWNRDAGRCVKCGSQQNLEFDHLIPFSKGGANTYRNLQILCKKCNIEKSNKIG